MKTYLTLIFTLFTSVVLAQQSTIKGRILADGLPLPGASIKIAHTTQGASTIADGTFVINGLKAGNYQVLFSAVGYQPQMQNIKVGYGNTSTLQVNMLPEASKLNEVIITGVSRATELRKNPVPVAVITKTNLERQLSTNIIETIVRGVPGVSAVTTGPNISKPFIRGLGYNRVLTLYDGIRQEGQQWGDEHGIEIDAYGLERVEVVKGPASLTYGSDALAGVINLIPANMATGKTLHGDFTTEYHTNNGMAASSVGLGIQPANWKYSFRATAKRAHDYKNPVDGYVYNTGFAELNLTCMASTTKKWGTLQLGSTLYHNAQEIPDGSRDSLTRAFTQQVQENDDIKNRPIVSAANLKTYRLAPLRQSISHYRIYAKSQLKLGEGNLNTLLGWQQNLRREYTHPTAVKQAALNIALNTLNFEVKYNLPVFNGFESTIGSNGFYQTNSNKNATDFPIPDYTLFDAGWYAFLKKSFGPVDLSGGVRYDTRHIQWSNFWVSTNPATGFGQQAGANTPGASLQFPSFSHNYTGISGSLGATYNITRRVLMKANIARGYRAPNITETGSNGLDPGAHIVYLGNRSFKPEFSLQQDAGFIAYLPNVDIQAEVFNNNIDNYIYQAKLTDAQGNPVVIVEGNSTYQYQQSKARLYGAELTLNLHPQTINWLELNNSVAIVRGINKNKQLVAQSNGEAKYLPFIPPLHWRSQLRIKSRGQYGICSNLSAGIEADVYAAQNRFYALDNTETYTPGYALINLSLGTTVKTPCFNRLDVFLQADNVFDKAYQSNLSRLKYFEYYQSSPNGRQGIYNMGRNVSIKAIWHF